MVVHHNSETLALLRMQIERIEKRHGTDMAASPRLSVGIPEIDAHLDGGLVAGGIHEVLSSGHDAACAARSARFVASVLSSTHGQVAWIGSRNLDVHAAGLRQVGLNPGRLICIEVPDEDVPSVAEDALRERGLVAVVTDIAEPLSLTISRRLLLAAERSGTTGFLLPRTPLETLPPTAACSRWRIAPRPLPRIHPSSVATLPPQGHGLWRLDLLRLRGGKPAAWDIEVSYAPPYSLALAPLLENRTPAPHVVPDTAPGPAACRATA